MNLIDHGSLTCLACKSTDVYVTAVRLGCRKGAEAPTVLYVDMDDGEVIPNPGVRAVSTRGNWLELVVYCEACWANSRIVLAQTDKGTTKVTARPE